MLSLKKKIKKIDICLDGFIMSRETKDYSNWLFYFARED